MSVEFKAWPKTPRLNRDMIITEKIDGTNAAVIVLSEFPETDRFLTLPFGTVSECGAAVLVQLSDGREMWVAAQSRKRVIKPGKQTDNAGFAGWVRENATALAEALGEGYHYGEWWGYKIQHGYGLDHKRFSLFNVVRYADADLSDLPQVDLVPVLYEGPFSSAVANELAAKLRDCGSFHPLCAHQKAEGVIVFHKAAGHVYKVLCENDELPKGVAEVQL